MQEKVQTQSVLGHWELHNPCVEERLNGKPPRLVYKIKTDSGLFVLKGYPYETPEATIWSNVQAHLFLGNEKGLAPRIYPLKNGMGHDQQIKMKTDTDNSRIYQADAAILKEKSKVG